jgi:UDP-glucose 4-epimerase
MKSLITGGAGFIGSHLAEKLLDLGEEVYVIDNLSTGSIDNIEHLKSNKNFHYVIDTIMNQYLLAELIDKCDIIYHLAAAVGVKLIVESPVNTIETNIYGTELVLTTANKKKKKVLIASSSEIYGKGTSIPFKEDDDMVLGATSMGRWSYACSKAIDEFLAIAYWREKKLPIVIARYFNTVGPRQTGRYGMVIPRFVRQALLNQPLTVYGDGKQSRCFTYVSDVVDATVKIAHSEKAVGEVYNIGSKEEVAIDDLARKVKTLTKSRSKIEHIPYEKAYTEGFEDMRRRVPDLSKIEDLIAYEPKINLDEILIKVIKHFQA